jgi:threonyl-tRNA synthetase
MKIPYILIVWEKEVNSDWVSVRVFKTKEQYEQSEKEFIKAAIEKRDSKSL